MAGTLLPTQQPADRKMDEPKCNYFPKVVALGSAPKSKLLVSTVSSPDVYNKLTYCTKWQWAVVTEQLASSADG